MTNDFRADKRVHLADSAHPDSAVAVRVVRDLRADFTTRIVPWHEPADLNILVTNPEDLPREYQKTTILYKGEEPSHRGEPLRFGTVIVEHQGNYFKVNLHAIGWATRVRLFDEPIGLLPLNEDEARAARLRAGIPEQAEDSGPLRSDAY